MSSLTLVMLASFNLITVVCSQRITISAVGDSLTSCNGVTKNQSFAYLSYREPLWHGFLAPLNSSSRTTVGGGVRIEMVGPRRGCNRNVDASYARSLAFPNFHNSYFGRSSRALLRDFESAAPNQVGVISLLLIGTNDFLLSGKANATEVATRIRRVAAILRDRGSAFVVVGVPPPIDASRLPHRRQIRWASYRETLRQSLLGSCPPSLKCWHDGVVGFEALDPVAHTYDGIHLNHRGEEEVAKAWFAVLGPIIHQLIQEYLPTGGDALQGTLDLSRAVRQPSHEDLLINGSSVHSFNPAERKPTTDLLSPDAVGILACVCFAAVVVCRQKRRRR